MNNGDVDCGSGEWSCLGSKALYIPTAPHQPHHHIDDTAAAPNYFSPQQLTKMAHSSSFPYLSSPMTFAFNLLCVCSTRNKLAN